MSESLPSSTPITKENVSNIEPGTTLISDDTSYVFLRYLPESPLIAQIQSASGQVFFVTHDTLISKVSIASTPKSPAPPFTVIVTVKSVADLHQLAGLEYVSVGKISEA